MVKLKVRISGHCRLRYHELLQIVHHQAVDIVTVLHSLSTKGDSIMYITYMLRAEV